MKINCGRPIDTNDTSVESIPKPKKIAFQEDNWFGIKSGEWHLVCLNRILRSKVIIKTIFWGTSQSENFILFGPKEGPKIVVDA